MVALSVKAEIRNVVHCEVGSISYLCGVHFISELRHNPATGSDDRYYRIKESFRDATGRVRVRVLLKVGFMTPRLQPQEVHDIAVCLNYIRDHGKEPDLFGDALSGYSETVCNRAREYWNQMVEQGSIDGLEQVKKDAENKARHLIDVDTVKHPDARDVGAEWICLQAIKELQLDKFLEEEGWSEVKINTALAHLIIRTIYTPSELASMRIMDENSDVCELVSGNKDWRPGFHGIYNVAPDLYQLKDKLDRHLRNRTDNLFNIANRIILFDLTNFYFESPKFTSKKAKFGRSKEKRRDCKLLVLALSVNREGFIRYSAILAGNTTDPASLPAMVDNLAKESGVPNEKKKDVLVVMDAGISTEKNLKLIKDKGYHYLCVSRTRLKDYELAEDAKTVTVHDSREQDIRLTRVHHEEGGDYYLEVNSPAKTVKEESMSLKFKERFEAEMNKIKAALTKKGGTKKYNKVIERVGRVKERYRSIAKYYKIEYIRDQNKNENMGDITWQEAVPDNIGKTWGKYFLQTDVDTMDEETTWNFYNSIRDIEETNRQLKTDLSLRPIYHQKDDNSDAHLYLGLLAYWIVNTIRHKIKLAGGLSKEFTTEGRHDNTPYWNEIVRMMSTQKAITTTATNALGEKVEMRICSEPTKAANEIYDKLKYKKMPFKKIKICSTQ